MTLRLYQSVKHYENRPLPPGKLPAPLLAELLSALPSTDPQLVLGPAVGEDAAIIDFAAGSENLLVAKIDPITFASDEIGYYAVNVCANDLAVTGATPRFYMPAILLPAVRTRTGRASSSTRSEPPAPSSASSSPRSQRDHAHRQPARRRRQPCSAKSRATATSPRGRPGDAILPSRRHPGGGDEHHRPQRRAVLLQQGWPAEELDRAAQFLFDPGISVLAPAHAATRTGLVTAMHDPTEGGVASGLVEMALAADAGLDVDLDALPIADLSPPVRRLRPRPARRDRVGRAARHGRRSTWALSWLRGGNAAGPARLSAISRRTPTFTRRSDGKPALFPHFAADEITKLWA